MARLKKKQRSDSDKVPSKKTPTLPISKLRPRIRVLVTLAVVVFLGWGLQVAWQQVAPSVIHRDRYLLTADHITTTALPEWITADVRTEVVRNSALDRRLSVLDDAFVSVVRDAFVLHPWVESVDQITKSYPPQVHVDLTFRRPAAVVELGGPQGVELIPVDRLGVQLPAADVPEIRKRYLPRIGGIIGRPPVGQPWTDPRVAGAADLAAELSDVWESLHLVDILPSARSEIQDEHRYFVFDLITSGGTRIVWGAAPNAGLPSEDSFEDKLKRLQKYIKEHGALDSVHGPAVVDVRKELAITPRTVKKTLTPRTVKKNPSTDKETPVIK